MTAPPSEGQGVTVVVRRRVRSDAIGEFEVWLEGILAATAEFPGHLGANVIRPAPGGDQDYVVIFRFDSQPHLAAWEESSERGRWLAKADAFTLGTAKLQTLTGLEYWFTLPSLPTRPVRPPPAWKMSVVTLAALFPLVHWVAPALRQLLAPAGLPDAAVTLLAVGVIVAVMTWLMMPFATRLARPWLFPGRPAPAPATKRP